jgi:hypothetical protein
MYTHVSKCKISEIKNSQKIEKKSTYPSMDEQAKILKVNMGLDY